VTSSDPFPSSSFLNHTQKSTCIALLELFYYCQSGSITLDGHNIQTLDPQWLRQNIGLVTQEPSLFATSIEENIRYGDRDYHQKSAEMQQEQHEILEDVVMAAKMANASEFIDDLPNGYATQVGEHGIRLSGGQKQRIAIARALFRSPKLLLLDEATSALDAASEHLVHTALDELLKNHNDKTVLVIAHRLSTVKSADVVYVVDGGEVKQIGTHNELVSQDGLYRQLVLRQLQRDPHDEIN
jgi:ABC-type multidrug transport system fused ATPase/permease subunit